MPGLMETLPVSGDVLEYMAGAVAFHRSFPAICDDFWDDAAADPERAASLLDAELRRRGSNALKVARSAIIDVFGGGCTADEMAVALAGLRSEAAVSLSRRMRAEVDESFDARP